MKFCIENVYRFVEYFWLFSFFSYEERVSMYHFLWSSYFEIACSLEGDYIVIAR